MEYESVKTTYVIGDKETDYDGLVSVKKKWAAQNKECITFHGNGGEMEVEFQSPVMTLTREMMPQRVYGEFARWFCVATLDYKPNDQRFQNFKAFVEKEITRHIGIRFDFDVGMISPNGGSAMLVKIPMDQDGSGEAKDCLFFDKNMRMIEGVPRLGVNSTVICLFTLFVHFEPRNLTRSRINLTFQARQMQVLKAYEPFALMKTKSRIYNEKTNFQVFLLGTSKARDNKSLVKHLPREILEHVLEFVKDPFYTHKVHRPSTEAANKRVKIF